MHEIRSNLVRGERRGPLATKDAARRSAPGHGLGEVKIRREEARRCNQRRESRHLNVTDQAVITFRRRSQEVAVLNVSSQGAMIASDLQPPIGARIDIRFADCNRTQCFVRWLRNGRIGLEFDKHTLIIAPPGVRELIVGGRRAGEQSTIAVKGARAPRRSLILHGDLHWASGSMAVRLRNISADGAMLEGSLGLKPETQIVLELAGGTAIPGRVRWCCGRQIGIRFDGAFDLTALAQVVPEAEQQGAEFIKPDYLQTELDPDSPWAARWERLSPDDL